MAEDNATLQVTNNVTGRRRTSGPRRWQDLVVEGSVIIVQDIKKNTTFRLTKRLGAPGENRASRVVLGTTRHNFEAKGQQKQTMKTATLFAIALVFFGYVSPAFSCTVVSSWAGLKKRIAKAADGTSLVFCPFKFSKPEKSRITIEKSIGILCDSPRNCILEGKGLHMLVQGPQAQLNLQGFVFRGATASAIDMREGSRRLNTITDCDFVKCVAKGKDNHGGAIRVDRGVPLTIDGCKFIENAARSGGSISFNGANLIIAGSQFTHGRAETNGIVYVWKEAKAEIMTTSFNYNKVQTTRKKKKGQNLQGVVTAVDSSNVKVRAPIEHEKNVGCDGVFLKKKRRCYPWDEIAALQGNDDSIPVSLLLVFFQTAHHA